MVFGNGKAKSDESHAERAELPRRRKSATWPKEMIRAIES
jgi:hypothetical protein